MNHFYKFFIQCNKMNLSISNLSRENIELKKKMQLSVTPWLSSSKPKLSQEWQGEIKKSSQDVGVHHL